MRIHIVHGILDTVGTSGLLRLIPYLKAAGFDVRSPDYGLITAAETRLANPIIVRTIAPYIEPGDLYVGHSNGCAIGYDLVLAGTPLAGLVLINAALRQDIALPLDMWADVYYNQGDDATVAAVLAERLGLVDPVWGEMGHAGYLGVHPKVCNINCGKPPEGLPVISGHGDIFNHLDTWGPFIARRILEHLPKP